MLLGLGLLLRSLTLDPLLRLTLRISLRRRLAQWTLRSCLFVWLRCLFLRITRETLVVVLLASLLGGSRVPVARDSGADSGDQNAPARSPQVRAACYDGALPPADGASAPQQPAVAPSGGGGVARQLAARQPRDARAPSRQPRARPARVVSACGQPVYAPLRASLPGGRNDLVRPRYRNRDAGPNGSLHMNANFADPWHYPQLYLFMAVVAPSSIAQSAASAASATACSKLSASAPLGT